MLVAVFSLFSVCTDVCVLLACVNWLKHIKSVFILSPPQSFQLGSGAFGIFAMTANEEEVNLVFPLGIGKGDPSSGGESSGPAMDETLSSRKRKDKPKEEVEGTAEQIQNLKDRLHKSELLRKSMDDELTVLKGKISEMDVLMNMIKRPSDNSFDLSVLKPIDTKDITKPEPFDGDAKKFLAWFAGIKDLLTHRNQGWKLILDHIEAMKNTKCHDPDTQLFQSIGGEVAVQAEAYKAQLATYIRS